MTEYTVHIGASPFGVCKLYYVKRRYVVEATNRDDAHDQACRLAYAEGLEHVRCESTEVHQ